MSDLSHEHVSCRRLLGDLSAYLDGEAAEALCREIEQHMATCENCRVVVDTLGMTIKLYRQYGHSSLPGAARRRLYAALNISEFAPASDPADPSAG